MTAEVKEPPHLQFDKASDTIKAPDDSIKKRLQRCPHPQEAVHQLWVMKVILTGARTWNDDSKKESGPHRDQRPRGQGTNSRHNQETAYPGIVEPSLDMRGVRPNEGPLPTYHPSQDESSDSTRVSSNRQRDKRPQLSDAMRARLGPQAPGKDRPHTATTQEKYLSPSAVSITRGNPSH
ncbi:hypothetical protein CK203_080646 [Vitis vinifera]|uniref:Uncharacterized protein n=1 Tax=Vitis vinifera TaxID=29760 RepID=A0A438EZF7_VITVI|nr:hypothetical protein CK203_080646 [Vitis vinifera]